jgi:hypothetical protein
LYRVEINGTVHELTPSLGDLVRFERKYGDIVKMENAEQIAYLVWLMATRTKATDVDFEAFLDALGDLDPVMSPKATPKKRSPQS